MMQTLQRLLHSVVQFREDTGHNRETNRDGDQHMGLHLQESEQEERH